MIHWVLHSKMIFVIAWTLTKNSLPSMNFYLSPVKRNLFVTAFVTPSIYYESFSWRRRRQQQLQRLRLPRQNQYPYQFISLDNKIHSTRILCESSDNRGTTDHVESHGSSVYNHLDDNQKENDVDNDSVFTIPGIPLGHYVVRQFDVPSIHQTYDLSSIDPDEIRRLSLTPINVTLPVALMILDPIKFPSMSKARKFCRKGYLVIRRAESHDSKDHTLQNEDNHKNTKRGNSTTFDDITCCFVGRVGDRVHPGDAIAEQIRIGNGHYPIFTYYPQPFDLPVLFEDDHMALVNKPAGVVVHKMRASKATATTTITRSLQECLPFVMTAPGYHGCFDQTTTCPSIG
jgi:hypothetical protein